ncbi:MAG: hypothetical protein QOJ23_775 [Actinomycetota bacterium]|jgi:hypothetical protein|nr:hypothetical protein [Actinomycetota bacterium]
MRPDMKWTPAWLACLVLVLGSCSGGRDNAQSRADGKTAPTTVPVTAPDLLTTTSTTPSPEPPADATPAGPDITVTATEYAFDAPRLVTGGVVNLTLRNAGRERHEALIVKVGDTPQPKVVQALDAFVNTRGQPIPDFLDFYGGIGTLSKGTESKASLTLPPGKYAIVCTLTDFDSLNAKLIPPGANAPELYTKGMYAPLTVRGDGGAALPGGDGTIVASDYAFKLPPFGAGPRTFVFRNDGAQPHFASIGEFPAGVDADAGRKALEALVGANPLAPAPDGTPEPADVAFAEPLGPKSAETFQLTLQAGRTYSIACFLSDRGGGPSHASGKHMFTVFTVPG